MTHSLTRRAVAVGLVAGVAVALAGCSGSNPSGSSDVDTKGATVTVVDSITSEPGSTDMLKTLEACAAPLGVKIQRETVPSGDVVQKVLQKASSHTLPDLLQLDNPDVDQFAGIGALHPLSDFGIETKGYNEGMLGASTVKGKVHGLAPSINTVALLYNKDVFAAAGLTPPTTWDELETTAKALTKDGKYGFSMSATASYEGTWQFLPWMWSNGGDEKNIDTPETAEALKLVVDMVQDGSMSPSIVGWGQGDVLDQFTAGDVPMIEGGIWTFSTLNAVKGLNWGITTLPVPNAGDKLVTPLGGKVWTLPETGDKAGSAAAAKVLECLNSDENQLASAKSNGAIPSKTSIATQFAKEDGTEYMKVAEEAVTHVRARTERLGSLWPQAATAIYTALQSAITGEASPEEALKSAQASAK
jgi:multiple sugar transport system substrate-binding protein